MCHNMKANIINIGNSQGVILPSTFLKKLKLCERSVVEVGLHNGVIVIKPEPRQGWAEAAKQMNAAGDDHHLLTDSPNGFEQDEWTW